VECIVSKEIKEWFKVIEIAEMLNLSKVSVYNKIKTINSNTLQGLQKKEKGITYFHVKAVNIIKAEFNHKQDTNVETATITEDYDIKDDFINTLKDQLKDQSAIIHELNERLRQEQELNKNNQVLQLRQPQNIKELEAHFQYLDTKIEGVKDNIQQRKDSQDISKSFFKKFFNKQ